MARVVYSAAARKDLLVLWRWYVEKAGIELADAVVDPIEKRISLLSQYPEMAPARPDIAPGARVLVVHRWLILHEMLDGTVRIVRVVDGATDIQRAVWTK